MALVEVSVKDRVAEVTLNRPEKLNAMNPQLLQEFDAALERLKNDADVSCILLAGSGRAFSVGYDLVGFRPSGGSPVSEDVYDDWVHLRSITQRWLDLWDYPKPVVSAVHGYCLAGALFMASCTDLVVVSKDCVLAWARIPLGAAWLTGVGALSFGVRKAKELSMIRGSQLTGEDAHALGWANYALPTDEVLPKARELAKGISRTPLDLLILNKRYGNQAMDRAGFREAITGGIEFNVIAHHSPGGKYVRAKLAELGLNGAIEWFDSGGTTTANISGEK